MKIMHEQVANNHNQPKYRGDFVRCGPLTSKRVAYRTLAENPRPNFAILVSTRRRRRGEAISKLLRVSDENRRRNQGLSGRGIVILALELLCVCRRERKKMRELVGSMCWPATLYTPLTHITHTHNQVTNNSPNTILNSTHLP
jgi:hypothetical protein